ncbi:IS3 family transposase [Rhodococcus sp. 15-1154-1]|nr:IS3 family transposase [Rhodococcus sp. 15-1154-1]
MATPQQTVLITAVSDAAAAGMSVVQACETVGIARSTYYRFTGNYSHYCPVKNPIPQTKRHQPAALTPQERAEIINVLVADEYTNLSVVETYWRALDAGSIACSQRAFYRVAKQALLVGDRRRRKHTAGSTSRRTPIVHAGGVGELWSWDITELRGPRTEDRYKLYLVIDVFSRYPVAWRIEYYENRKLVVEMFTAAIAAHGKPGTVHADNGAVMRSNDLIDLLEKHQVVPSYSRPRVSDDNPFSESLFKTIKYDLDCPTEFDNIEHARRWTEQFLHRYATEHRHSGLGRHTPHEIHHGTAAARRTQRQHHLDAYWTAHPERFRARPTAPELPKPTGINIHLSQTG